MRTFFLCALVLSAACGGLVAMSQPPDSIKDAPHEVQELHWVVVRLNDEWYRVMDERKFWKKVSRRGPLGNRDPSVFSSAFSKPKEAVKSGTRLLTVEPFLQDLQWRDDMEVLNPGNMNFAILRVDLERIRRKAEGNTDDFSAEEIALLGRPPPPEPFLAVAYAIEGNGFVARGIFQLWVLEGNTWRLWDMLSFPLQ